MRLSSSMVKFISLVSLAFVILIQLDSVFSLSLAEDHYVVKRTVLPGSKITGLTWQGDFLEIQHKKYGERVKYYVSLKGNFLKEKCDLYAHNRLVARSVSGDFTIKVAFTLKPVQLSLRAIGPTGTLETEEILLVKISKPNFDKD